MPQLRVLASSKLRLGGICIAMSPLIMIYSAKAPSSGSTSLPSNVSRKNIVKILWAKQDNIQTSVSHAYNPIAGLKVSCDILAYFDDNAGGIAAQQCMRRPRLE